MMTKWYKSFNKHLIFLRSFIKSAFISKLGNFFISLKKLLNMTTDITNISDVELEIDKVGELSSLSPRGGISLDQSGNNLAPPPRRKSFSRLRRRLSQTFRFSLNGSMAELSGGFNSGTFGDRQEKSMGK